MSNKVNWKNRQTDAVVNKSPRYIPNKNHIHPCQLHQTATSCLIPSTFSSYNCLFFSIENFFKGKNYLQLPYQNPFQSPHLVPLTEHVKFNFPVQLTYFQWITKNLRPHSTVCCCRPFCSMQHLLTFFYQTR
jgi:hypothetical protein